MATSIWKALGLSEPLKFVSFLIDIILIGYCSKRVVLKAGMEWNGTESIRARAK